MEIGHIIPHIEALIFASDKPLTALEITELINNAFGFMEDKITLDQIESCIEGIKEKYDAEFYPFEIRESGGGLQFLTKKAYHKTVGQLNGDKFLKRLSAAALETLSIIAYKQPITKGEIESIRGVSTDYSIQKLLEKELIIICGRSETLPGKPLLYQTSKSFMDYFGLNTPEDLPKIKEVLAEQIMPTAIVNGQTQGEEGEEDEVVVDTLTETETEIETDEDLALEVTEDGELIENHVSQNHTEEEITDVLNEEIEISETGDEEIADMEEADITEEASEEASDDSNADENSDDEGDSQTEESDDEEKQ
ncbi:SMC-Scp complex subunit ScpB [Pinibacter aurantiacus]|uniref:SMC-Scp complex subunit ScpB n=1 Tax=Pinibacter aurantiacus TaxID=2851599 RepID=A0A9E2SF76_9BACT|nr:SMC-Scp complex subunit ScpB [Pinibacter aurantiacus]MBV4359750.1 SMC-Scp complex subunit ScpB [Pinibacter aurantiacus]